MSLIHPDLAAVLRCTVDKAVLTEDLAHSQLVCTQCGRRYPVQDGIPNMVVEEAEGGDGD